MGKIRLDEQATPATPPTGFAEIFVDSVDKHLKQIDDAGAVIDLTLGGGSGGGFHGFGLWRYRTEITSTPTAGRLNFDDTTVDDATELYVNVLNDGGTDLSAFLSLLVVGDLIYIQAQDDATQFIAAEIGGTPSLASGVFTFPLSSVESQGAAMTNNEVVAFLASHSGGGASHDPVTLAGTPNYITLAGQVITRALINLVTHVTGILPIANVVQTLQLLPLLSVILVGKLYLRKAVLTVMRDWMVGVRFPLLKFLLLLYLKFMLLLMLLQGLP